MAVPTRSWRLQGADSDLFYGGLRRPLEKEEIIIQLLVNSLLQPWNRMPEEETEGTRHAPRLVKAVPLFLGSSRPRCCAKEKRALWTRFKDRKETWSESPPSFSSWPSFLFGWASCWKAETIFGKPGRGLKDRRTER